MVCLYFNIHAQNKTRLCYWERMGEWTQDGCTHGDHWGPKQSSSPAPQGLVFFKGILKIKVIGTSMRYSHGEVCTKLDPGRHKKYPSPTWAQPHGDEGQRDSLPPASCLCLYHYLLSYQDGTENDPHNVLLHSPNPAHGWLQVETWPPVSSEPW
jgi:hypothetical protein